MTNVTSEPVVIDTSILILVIAWSITKTKFLKEVDLLQASDNRHTLYLLTVSHVLNMYYYCVTISVILILLFYLLKILLLEQIANAAGGTYPFSVESWLKRLLHFTTSKTHLVFHLVMFVVINIMYYVAIMFIINTKTDKKQRKTQLSFLFDLVLVIYIVSYIFLMLTRYFV